MIAFHTEKLQNQQYAFINRDGHIKFSLNKCIKIKLK